ncbi:MAG TPA: PAS domain S-box protein [Methanoculleus sp.]|nr:PAS domain S-box protein [Methanoculleus sp.]
MRSVLFIGDIPTLTAISTHFQNAEGIAVETADSTEAGLEKVLTGRYDVIVSDHGMPGINGIELLKTLRASGNDAPFILFTANEDRATVVDALNHGADYYIQREECAGPVPEELDTVIRRLAEENRTAVAEEQYRAFFENSSAATVVLNDEGEIISANKQFERLCGYTREQLSSMAWMDFAAPGDREQIQESFRNRRACHDDTPVSYQFRFVRRNGDVMDVLATNAVIPGMDLQISAVFDISGSKQLERTLQAERERLHVTLRSIGDGVIVTDGDGRVTLLNRAAEDLTGWREDEAAGKSLSEVFRIINERTREPCHNPAEMVIESGNVIGLADHTVLIARNGTERVIADSGAPIRDSSGEIVGVVLVFRDVTREKRAEEATTRLASIVENSNDAILGITPEGLISTWNRGAEQVYGYTADEAIGRHVSTLAPPDRQSETLKVIEKIGKGEIVEHFETIRRKGGGDLIHISATISPLRDDDGEISGFSAISRDVTEKILMEKALEEQKEWLSITLRSIGDAVIATDNRGLVTFMNPVAGQLTGWPADEARGRPLEEIFVIRNEHTGEQVESPVKKVLREGIVVGLANHTELIAKGGTVWPIDDSAAPIRNANGDMIGIVLVFHEISEKKKAEKAIVEANHKYRDIIEFLPDATCVIDTNGVVIAWNRATETLTGVPKEEIIGKGDYAYALPFYNERRPCLIDFVGLDASAIPQGYLDLRREGEAIYSDRFVPSLYNGKGAHLWLKASPLYDSTGTRVGAIQSIRDITGIKQIERKLRESEETYRTVFEYTGTATAILEDDGIISLANTKLGELLGIPVARVQGTHITRYFQGESLEKVREYHRRRRTGPGTVQVYEAQVVRDDGEARDVLLTVGLIPGTQQSVASLLDITAQKQYEKQLKKYAQDLQRSNQELEHFAYVASHDLQEPLRAVASHTQILAKNYMDQLSPDAEKHMTFVVDGASRMKELIDDLLMYSRVQTRGKPFEATDCEAVLSDVLKNLQLKIQESSAVISHDPLPTVQGDATQLRQIFQNLIENALKFSGDQAPRVQVSVRELPDTWEFSVRDNGIGIDPQYFERIFVIFQRLHTRSEYSGTGLGLAICKRIVERHGGGITVESRPGEGSTFSFTIAKNLGESA